MSSMMLEPRGHAHRIYEVVEGRDSGTTDLVTNSWARCVKDYRLDPDRPTRPTVLTDRALEERRTRAADVIDCAKLEMTTLYQQLGDRESAVVLVDTEGTILHMVAAPEFARDMGKVGFCPGAVWSESAVGTNGMGTCLVVGEPVAVRQHDHFFGAYTGLTCSAVPIFDPDGALVAVLDVTSRSQLMQQHSLVLLSMTAQMIENRLLDLRFRDACPIHFHSRPEFVYTLHEGKIVVADDGSIRAANRSALFQLGIASVQEIRGKKIDEVFQTTLPDILQRSARSSFHPVPTFCTQRSNRFFVVAQEPATLYALNAERGSAKQLTVNARAVAAPDTEFGDDRIAQQLSVAARVIAKRIPVLLHGETGAGKEVFARALHKGSPFANGAFVAVNCASLPESLIESELFGYRAGAFTGAQRTGRRGKILQADRGTLFLDEIGDMPLALQARLLRVLDERQISPLGSEETIPVDFQLVSASHRNLPKLVAEGIFREDLYYRLSGLEVSLPPLRERADKRELLYRVLQEEAAGQRMAIDADAEALLLSHPWPGNLRQLRHVLRTAVVLAGGDRLRMEDLPPALRQRVAARPEPIALPAMAVHEPEGVAGGGSAVGSDCADDELGALNPVQASERAVLLGLLEQQRWNVSNVAKALDISRNTLYRRLHRLRIPLSNSDSSMQ
ncbi:MAG TPA: sigma-54-dependent Fis family transcriptional regulator [Aromatoleum sp.]|uniref:sigma-54-dependent Fis family transcriptional regulator n=1 Tax=Aromatoleum sp. TaxID=2307007 RepID=UPI002B4A1EE5|nr:sigma-54-dependent Fis family transcriptional regulator [Aromatoleum sp.]HJV25854.1 sigma-54-dependent Fis family transcriptional regulator [Aromatoleum sp.]